MQKFDTLFQQMLAAQGDLRIAINALREAEKNAINVHKN
jgi:hypothetical protein